ncbi:MAG: CHASE3 domain-containing protein [Betaproteobacteria bacterium]|nr:CHASE3 domain-containing protein [Betaproteobacteria bacterium]
MSRTALKPIAVPLREWLVRFDRRLETLFGRAGGTLWTMPIAIALAASALWIADAGLEVLNRSFGDFSFAQAIARQTRELRLALVDAETGQLGYTLIEDPAYLDPYATAIARLPEIRRELARLAHADHEGQTLFKEVEANLDRLLEYWRSTIDLVNRGEAKRAQTVLRGGRGKAIMDDLLGDMKWLERIHESRLASFEEVWRQSLLAVRTALALLIVMIAAVFLLALRYAQHALATERRQKSYVEDERDRLERAVRERTVELSELAGHLQRVQEQERASVARELHDEMGALLTASKMTVAWLRRLGPDLPAAAMDRLLRLDAYLEQGVELKRRVIEGLSPSALANLGLNAALQDLAEQVTSTGGLRVSFRRTGAHPEPEPETAIAIYRVAQEALNNVQKHARASEVQVELECAQDWIELRVRDDGQGYAGGAVGRTMGHGLRGMRHRAESLGGSLAVGFAPDRGLCVTMRVPRTSTSAS